MTDSTVDGASGVRGPVKLIVRNISLMLSDALCLFGVVKTHWQLDFHAKTTVIEVTQTLLGHIWPQQQENHGRVDTKRNGCS